MYKSNNMYKFWISTQSSSKVFLFWFAGTLYKNISHAWSLWCSFKIQNGSQIPNIEIFYEGTNFVSNHMFCEPQNASACFITTVPIKHLMYVTGPHNWLNSFPNRCFSLGKVLQVDKNRAPGLGWRYVLGPWIRYWGSEMNVGTGNRMLGPRVRC